MKNVRATILFFAVSLLFVLGHGFSLAGELFNVEMSQDKVVLQSGSLTASVSRDDKGTCLKINSHYGIGIRIKFGSEKDWLYFSGIHLKEAKSVVDREDAKKVSLIFQNNFLNKLQLDLRIEKAKKNILFVDSFIHNIDEIPQNIKSAWFSANLFSEYVSSECSKYPMPEEAGVDFTGQMPFKKHWTTLGPDRWEKWIYFSSKDKKIPGLGIISQKPTSFGMRDDKLVYWAEWEGVIEEGDSANYSYTLILTNDLKEIQKELK